MKAKKAVKAHKVHETKSNDNNQDDSTLEGPKLLKILADNGRLLCLFNSPTTKNIMLTRCIRVNCIML